MNTLLGGSFTSRLNDNLREQHGYTYGARSALRRTAPPAGSSSPSPTCRPTRRPRRSTEFFKELERIRTPATAGGGRAGAQLRGPRLRRRTSRPRPRWRAGWPTASSTTCRRASSRSSSRRRSPPTSAALQAAARVVVDPARMAFVVVGDRKAVEAPTAGPRPRDRAHPHRRRGDGPRPGGGVGLTLRRGRLPPERWRRIRPCGGGGRRATRAPSPGAARRGRCRRPAPRRGSAGSR